MEMFIVMTDIQLSKGQSSFLMEAISSLVSLQMDENDNVITELKATNTSETWYVLLRLPANSIYNIIKQKYNKLMNENELVHHFSPTRWEA